MANTVSQQTVLVEKEITIADKIAAKQNAPTVWTTDQKDWVYVTIPEENALGEKHDTMGLNTHYFEAGKTYLVPQEVAAFLKERLSVYAKACIRVLQPKRDISAEKAVELYGTKGGRPVEPSVLQD